MRIVANQLARVAVATAIGATSLVALLPQSAEARDRNPCQDLVNLRRTSLVLASRSFALGNELVVFGDLGAASAAYAAMGSAFELAAAAEAQYQAAC
jgi:hypothetical protein